MKKNNLNVLKSPGKLLSQLTVEHHMNYQFPESSITNIEYRSP